MEVYLYVSIYILELSNDILFRRTSNFYLDLKSDTDTFLEVYQFDYNGSHVPPPSKTSLLL